MPEPDDNSQAAAYLDKTIGTRAGVPEPQVWLNVYETPGNRSYQAQCPPGLVNEPVFVRNWASEELANVGLKVKDWDTPPGWRQWNDGEYSYRATGVEALSEVPTADTGFTAEHAERYEQEAAYRHPVSYSPQSQVPAPTPPIRTR